LHLSGQSENRFGLIDLVSLTPPFDRFSEEKQTPDWEQMFLYGKFYKLDHPPSGLDAFFLIA
jgi:hypothetical protein